MPEATAYQMAINNTAEYVRTHKGSIDAFTASTVLAVAFCKSKEETFEDMMNANKEAIA